MKYDAKIEKGYKALYEHCCWKCRHFYLRLRPQGHYDFLCKLDKENIEPDGYCNFFAILEGEK